MDELAAGAPFNPFANRNRTQDDRLAHLEWYNSTLATPAGTTRGIAN